MPPARWHRTRPRAGRVPRRRARSSGHCLVAQRSVQIALARAPHCAAETSDIERHAGLELQPPVGSGAPNVAAPRHLRGSFFAGSRPTRRRRGPRSCGGNGDACHARREVPHHSRRRPPRCAIAFSTPPAPTRRESSRTAASRGGSRGGMPNTSATVSNDRSRPHRRPPAPRGSVSSWKTWGMCGRRWNGASRSRETAALERRWPRCLPRSSFDCRCWPSASPGPNER